jgi:hypothetical protein
MKSLNVEWSIEFHNYYFPNKDQLLSFNKVALTLLLISSNRKESSIKNIPNKNVMMNAIKYVAYNINTKINN